MDGARTRLGSALEWIVAAAALGILLLALSSIGWLFGGDGAPGGGTPLPPGVPPGALSVPSLMLVDGKEVRVGDSVAVVADLLGRHAESGRQEIDRRAPGERLTRYYEYRGTRFILVFGPVRTEATSRVAAIYLP
jgi:hypothetical protein